MSVALVSRTLARRRALDHLWRWTRACRRCRNIVGPIDVLCRSCLDELVSWLPASETLRRSGYPFPVYGLVSWDDENEELVRAFVHGFKGGFAWRAAGDFAERLAQLRAPSPDLKTVFLYPRATTDDHAWLLAWAFAGLVRGAVVIPLEPESARNPQKGLELGERSRRRFVPLEGENISLCVSPQVRCVFVDDIVTSGSTAMAAFWAAGEPASYEVWTIAARAKLAVKSRL